MYPNLDYNTLFPATALTPSHADSKDVVAYGLPFAGNAKKKQLIVMVDE